MYYKLVCLLSFETTMAQRKTDPILAISVGMMAAPV